MCSLRPERGQCVRLGIIPSWKYYMTGTSFCTSHLGTRSHLFQQEHEELHAHVGEYPSNGETLTSASRTSTPKSGLCTPHLCPERASCLPACVSHLVESMVIILSPSLHTEPCPTPRNRPEADATAEDGHRVLTIQGHLLRVEIKKQGVGVGDVGPVGIFPQTGEGLG